MNNPIHHALEIFFEEIGPEGFEKYKLGVLDFTGKLRDLITALEEKDEKQIHFLLHSVKPLSAYLKIDPLTELLSSVREHYERNATATKDQLRNNIEEIEGYVKKL